MGAGASVRGWERRAGLYYFRFRVIASMRVIPSIFGLFPQPKIMIKSGTGRGGFGRGLGEEGEEQRSLEMRLERAEEDARLRRGSSLRYYPCVIEKSMSLKYEALPPDVNLAPMSI